MSLVAALFLSKVLQQQCFRGSASAAVAAGIPRKPGNVRRVAAAASWSWLFSCRCRTFATGTKKSRDNNNNKNNNNSSQDVSREIFWEEMEELKLEREALYGFTAEDFAGWSTNSQNHKHTSSFLAHIDAAREATGTTVNELEDDDYDDDDYDDDYQSNPMQDNDTVPFSFRKLSGENHGDGPGGASAVSVSRRRPPPPSSHASDDGRLTHLTRDGSSIHMVDVGDKMVTKRTAVAETRVSFPPNVWKALTANSRSQDLVGPKGPILTTAKIAGIMAAKKTSDLVPLCHPLPITSVNVDIVLEEATRTAIIHCTCKVEHKTGVEMEALTGASVTALVIYDMCKALSHDIVIERTCLIQKSGGKRTVNKEGKQI